MRILDFIEPKTSKPTNVFDDSRLKRKLSLLLSTDTQLSKIQDEVLLFSIAIHNPPSAAARVSDRNGGGSGGGRVIGGGFAEECEENLTREERHLRACRFVAGVHR